MDRAKKEKVVEELGQIFDSSGVVVVARYDGMTVAQMQDLRARMRDAGGSVRVAKNRLAKIALAQSFYGHFYVEHNRGHHVRVATPEDPASSRVGESLYAFLPRTVLGSLRSAWNLEKPRFKRRNQSHWSIRNDVVNSWLMSLVLWGALVAVFGWRVLPFLLVQAVVGIGLLEVVNYLEHYGLLRQKTSAGRYQRCRPEHSWNSDHLVTNIFLYHLQRHSDHHASLMQKGWQEVPVEEIRSRRLTRCTPAR